eukprot:COSAG02_NODE_55668_length_289_cov_0.815789_1_plen_21_part_10
MLISELYILHTRHRIPTQPVM